MFVTPEFWMSRWGDPELKNSLGYTSELWDKKKKKGKVSEKIKDNIIV